MYGASNTTRNSSSISTDQRVMDRALHLDDAGRALEQNCSDTRAGIMGEVVNVVVGADQLAAQNPQIRNIRTSPSSARWSRTVPEH